jgi:hypothetical protein
VNENKMGSAAKPAFRAGNDAPAAVADMTVAKTAAADMSMRDQVRD